MKKAHKDVSKEGGYLGKEWCLVVVGTMKEGWYSPNHHYFLFPLFEKWRRERMRSFIQILTHRKSWRRAPFFLLGFVVWIRFGVCFFFLPLESDSSMSLIFSMVIPWFGNEKSRNICILHGLPTILWNRSHFHKLQHCTTWLLNLLKKKI